MSERVEAIRQQWSDNSGPKSPWTDVWDLLRAYDEQAAALAQAEQEREEARAERNARARDVMHLEADLARVRAALEGLPQTIRGMKFRPGDPENLVDNAFEMVARKVETEARAALEGQVNNPHMNSSEDK